MKTTKIQLQLTNERIGEAVNTIEGWLSELELQRRDLLALSLSMEETMLRWQDRFGSEKEFELIKCSRLGQPYLLLSLAGEEYDPLDEHEDELDWSKQLMVEMGLAPEFRYSKGNNEVWIKLKKAKAGAFFKIFVAGAIAIVLGALGKFLFPESAAMIQAALIKPLREALLGLLTATAGPLVFLSVMLGVCGMDNLNDFGKLGKSTIGRYTLVSLMFNVIFCAAVLPFFSLNFEKTGFTVEQLSGTVDILLDILPKNMVEPFVSGNTLQIVVLGVLVGLAILAMGSRADGVRSFADDAFGIVSTLLGWANKLLPVLVFLVLLENLWGEGIGMLAAILKPVVITYFACALMPLAALLICWLKLRLPLGMLAKKILPAGLLALATCSSSACLGTIMDNSEKEMGIDTKLVSFGAPIGSITAKPCTSALFFVCAIFCAEHFACPCSPSWLIMALITAFMLAVASPPVPGGLLVCFAALLSQLGLPEEALIMAISLDLCADRIVTTANVLFQQLILILSADKLNMLNRDVFMAKK